MSITFTEYLRSCDVNVSFQWKKETEMRPLIDIDEAAQFLKVSKWTPYTWVHRKKIPYCKVGGHVRFRPEEIEEWLRKNHVTARVDSFDERAKNLARKILAKNF